MKKQLLALLGLIIGIAIVIGIANSAQNNQETGDPSKPTIAASIFPLYDITREIAGENFNVELILPPGASPHLFEPTPRQVQSLQSADRVFVIGLELDEWVEDFASPEKITSVETGIELKEPRRDHDHEEEHADEDHHEEEHADDHGEFDPHYWLSPENAMTIAKNIADQLIVDFPEQEEVILQNLVNYLAELQDAYETSYTIINEVGNKNLITLHDAWYYFADAYPVEIVGTYVPSAGKDPLPQDIIELQELVEEYGIQTLYTEPQISTASIQSFIEDNDLEVAVLDPLGGTDGIESYIDLILYNANTLAAQP